MSLPTTPLSALTTLVAPFVPGCPDPMIEEQLRQAAIEFCERTKVWREELTVSFDAQNEVVATPVHAALHWIEAAEFEDAAGYARPITPARFAQTTVLDRSSTTPGTALYITQASPNTITLVPFQVGTVRLSAILKPIALPVFGEAGALQAARNVIPTFLATEHGARLADGALWRLASMPGKKWSNPALAQQRFLLFDTACAARFDLGGRGQQRAPHRVRARWV